MFDIKKFKAQMVLKGFTGKQLADALNINESTFYRKLNDNGRFSREEINKMVDLLSIEDPKVIFFADELA